MLIAFLVTTLIVFIINMLIIFVSINISIKNQNISWIQITSLIFNLALITWNILVIASV
jgi:hypothetical protein